MKPNIQTKLGLLAALIGAGVVFYQQTEIRQLQRVLAELTSHRQEAAAANLLPANTEERHQQAADILGLQTEIAQLRKRTVKASALQTSIDELTAKVAAMSVNVSSPVAQAAAPVEMSPEEAAWRATALPAGREQDRAMQAALARWGHSNPLAAATWTTQLPEGSLRDQAMYFVAREWGLEDWNATAGWLVNLPLGSSRDAAIDAFVESVDGHDIKLALEWANRMQAPENRARRVGETAQRWLREDNAAARAWLATAQLPPGMAEQLLRTK